MSVSLLAIQTLNGLQLGVLLFLMGAGLTLVFGIMDFLNLAHGALYTAGAYAAVTVGGVLGSYVAGMIVAVPICVLLGFALERSLIRRFYGRSHLDQVLLTFGLLLLLDELVRMIWGPNSLAVAPTGVLATSVELFDGMRYSLYRLVIIAAGLVVAGLLYLLIQRSRLGMIIRAGAADRAMIAAQGVNVDGVFTLVFGLGAGLAALAGMIAAPIVSVQPGMGDNVLILAFVVIVIGGVGSVRGAFVAALIVGLADTLGRNVLVALLDQFVPASIVTDVSSASSSMLIYVLMAGVLAFAPQGLLPAPAARNG